MQLYFKVLPVYALLLLLALSARPLPAAPLAPESGGETTRVSVASDGTAGNNNSYWGSISATGRFVAFTSQATNFAPGINSSDEHVYVHDSQTGETTLLSRTATGTPGDRASRVPSISADGRWVAFESQARNFVRGEYGNAWEIFLADRATGSITRLTTPHEGAGETFPSGRSHNPAISADGQWIAFESDATNLIANDQNNFRDIFLYDRIGAKLSRVSVTSTGAAANGPSDSPAISDDGRFIAFRSVATNLVPGATNGHSHIYVHDRESGETSLITLSGTGAAGNNHSYDPSISADGRWVTFISHATNLVPGASNTFLDVFLHDRWQGVTTRVSLAVTGGASNGNSYEPVISADGRFIAFESDASNLVPGDNNNFADIFTWDRLTGEMRLVSVAMNGAAANFYSYGTAISADGSKVLFSTDASNLVPNDTNGAIDIFVRDIGPFTRWIYVPYIAR